MDGREWTELNGMNGCRLADMMMMYSRTYLHGEVRHLSQPAGLVKSTASAE